MIINASDLEHSDEAKTHESSESHIEKTDSQSDDAIGHYAEGEAITSSYIESNHLRPTAPLTWLKLALQDFKRAPVIAIFYGVIFTIIPMSMMYFAVTTQNLMYLFPTAMAFAIIGPVFASGLYDVAWELEKNHKPTLKHSLKSMFRNPVNEWGFALLLVVLMIAWMRLAGLIYAIYPSVANPSFSDLSAFLMIGTLAGAVMTALGFAISAFTPQILMERKVDLATAIVSSFKAVQKNKSAMFIWAACIFGLVLLGFATGALGFIVIMPILSFASWHGYIAVIKTKRQRKYQ